MSSSETVLDDVSMRGCIPISKCPCKHDKIYESNEVYQEEGRNWYFSHYSCYSEIIICDLLVCAFYLKSLFVQYMLCR